MGEDPDDEKAKKQAMAAQVCKAGGAVFMLAAPVIGFNLGGVADMLDLEGTGKYVVVAMFFVVGLFDFFLLPSILNGKTKI